MEKLLSPYQMGNFTLKNRVVMAPMTRSRCIDNIPGELVAQYYRQRAEAGLIITEGTSPSPNGLGYPRIPGIFSEGQVAGWKSVAKAVHEKNAIIFLQLMHTGRVGHPLNLPKDAKVKAPSAIPLSGEMYTDAEGPKSYPVPLEMTDEDIERTISEYVDAAVNAVERADMDGVELHGANGYLIDQFLNTASNQRSDKWGGSIENRTRFALEVTKRVAARIGRDKTGIRLSPYGVFNDMAPDDQMNALYLYLTEQLSKLKIAYIHVVDHSSMGAPAPDGQLIAEMREKFDGTFILSGGYDAARAEGDLQADNGDLVAFGRPFIANPNLVTAFEKKAQLAQPDFDSFYTPGPKGYVDYPNVAVGA
ncbi:MAG: alkene reductase [Deltaproteobacteria bacterium]|nr:alkene reductase [Deltaproteobacteria bacterium]